MRPSLLKPGNKVRHCDPLRSRWVYEFVKREQRGIGRKPTYWMKPVGHAGDETLCCVSEYEMARNYERVDQ